MSHRRVPFERSRSLSPSVYSVRSVLLCVLIDFWSFKFQIGDLNSVFLHFRNNMRSEEFIPMKKVLSSILFFLVTEKGYLLRNSILIHMNLFSCVFSLNLLRLLAAV